MTKESRPAFQFYVKEWRSSRAVQRMTAAQRGMYLEMLIEQWEKITLPDDPVALCDAIGFTVAEWEAAWPVLRANFKPVPRKQNRIFNLRLAKVRADLKTFRKTAQSGGQSRAKSATRRTNGTYAPAVSPAGHPAASQPSASTAIATAIATAIPITTAGPPPPDARSKRPIFTGQKLTVFEWMLDECLKTLGPFSDDFDLHEWFYTLDAEAFAANLIIPKRDGGAWLQGQLVREAQRRGLPLVVALVEPAPLGKLSGRMAAMVGRAREGS